MNPARKRTAGETWRAIEAMAASDGAERAEAAADVREMARIQALSPGAVDRELAESGMDPAVVRARGREVARTAAGAVAPAPAKPRPTSVRTALLLAAVLAVAVLAVLARPGGEIARWLHRRPIIGPDRSSPASVAEQRPKASDLPGAAEADRPEGGPGPERDKPLPPKVPAP
jgi:hypothetical protein